MGTTNWKRLYTDASRMLDKYQNEVVPKLREQLANCVEVVHGHWNEGVNNGFCCCSNCRDVYILQEWLTDGKWNYCPNCGAKMDGDGNG